MTALAVAGWGFLLVCVLLTVAEALDSWEAWRLKDEFAGEAPVVADGSLRVSVHVPISSEPPAVVLAGLERLSELRYRDFEVIVVDNNTQDAALWRPVARYCEQRPERFRFVHVERLAGAKAGALNLALARTDPAAEAIAVVDCDYLVSPGFLRAATAWMRADPRVGFVQSPQDYRVSGPGDTRSGWLWEYAQFFAAGMRTRARRNAALLHGTLVLVRKEALVAVGGWAEWCVTEDSELGLRLLAAGHQGVYVERREGLGMLPLSLADYHRQRRRWVTGGAQTLRRYWRSFLWPSAGCQLTPAQRLHYLQGWVPWVRDGLQVLAIVPLTGVLVMSMLGGAVPASATVAATGLLLMAAHVLLRQALVMPAVLGLRRQDRWGAFVTAVGLTWPIGTAWLWGLLTGRGQFVRTPKTAAAARRPSEGAPILLGGLLVVSAACAVVTDPAAAVVAAAAATVGLQLLAARGISGRAGCRHDAPGNRPAEVAEEYAHAAPWPRMSLGGPRSAA